MPIYEYRCEQGHTFEVIRRMTDDPLSECVTCSAPVEQVFHPITVHFKGTGFYNTDYGTQKRSREQQEKNSSEKAKTAETTAANGSSDASSSSTEAKPGAAKPAEAKSSGSESKSEKKAPAPAPKKSTDN